MLENETLRVRIGTEGKHADLKELHTVAVHLREALYALAKEQTDEEKLSIRFEVVDAKIGSLELTILPQDTAIAPEHLLSEFVRDVQSLAQGQFRPTMRTTTLNGYKTLIKSVPKQTLYCFTYREMQVTVDEQVKQQFQQVLKLSPSHNLELIGTIERVSVLRKPYGCAFYTKLEPRERVECSFEEHLLNSIADALKSRRLVRLRGTGYYAPIGLYPLRFEIKEPVVPVEPDYKLLREAVRSYEIVPAGMSLEQYLDSLRKSDEETP